MANLFTAPLVAWLGKLSYPRMFVVIAVLFGITVLVPDPIPFVDELLLGLTTIALANRKKKQRGTAGDPTRAPIDGEAHRR
ncbi:hypothetical protein LDO26_10355 [Luteimonas sp. BDR2-5]|uniref:DUF6116 family protein n=1 Tax=Proluteimonas luteida TaxID=2878685 RepID=UPI001E3404AC|nr:DUF6116 family protein [Luteimonas sp. BDR2-5]MCD9028607.1 hypothetical protein [Luteimonas sp. BDR2-5]